MGGGSAHQTKKGMFDLLEETLIAVLLGLMTLITFANVIARYVFNANILWALEVTVFLFAWLVLLGASYGVKQTLPYRRRRSGQGVASRCEKGPDADRGCRLPCLQHPAAQGIMGLLVAVCRQAGAFLETDDVPMPGFLQFFSDWLNEGERYEKLPRFIPYAVLPLSMALADLFRFLQVRLAGRHRPAGTGDRRS